LSRHEVGRSTFKEANNHGRKNAIAMMMMMMMMMRPQVVMKMMMKE